MYKLIAIDLDGTLLDKNKTISNENSKAIKEACEKGIDVVICSGRIYKGAMIFARMLGLKSEVISCNGAIIRDSTTGHTIFSKNIDVQDSLKILDFLSNANVYYHAYVLDTMFAKERGYGTVFYENINMTMPDEHKIDLRSLDGLEELIVNEKKGVTKFVVASNNLEYLAEVRHKINCMADVSSMSSNYDNFEVVKKGVSKGDALRILCDIKDIKPGEVMAIGDNENDLSMFEFAGTSVAMGNASDYIKSCADFVTLSNDECGVAHAIYKFVFKR